MKNKVVYIHKRLDKDEVFYVGIGSEKRANSRHGRNRLWKIIEKKSGGFEVEVLYDNLTIEEAKEIEKDLILQYGRIELRTGPLANLTDGADGSYNISEETRKLMSDFRKGLLSGERNGRYGMPVSEETRKKISDALKGKPLSEETKKKISDVLKGREVSDETRNKLSELNKGVPKTEEHKKNLSISRKKMFNENPHKLEEMRQRERQRYIDNPELKEEMRQRERENIINSDNDLRPGICKVKKNGKYQVQIRIGDSKRIYIGQFETYEEALEARLKAEDKYWGTNHYPGPDESNEPVS
jgi:hypothetical protein